MQNPGFISLYLYFVTIFVLKSVVVLLIAVLTVFALHFWMKYWVVFDLGTSRLLSADARQS